MLLRESGHARQAPNLALDILRKRVRANAQARQQGRHHTVGLCRQGSKQVNRLNLLVFMAPGNFLGALQRFLCLHRHLVKSQHESTSTPTSNKGAGFSPAPYNSQVAAYFAPAIAGVPTLTLTSFALPSSRFGIVTVTT